MADAVGYFGMRGSGNWTTDERPKSYREKILELYPNGDMPLTGLLSKTASEVATDPEFNWWEEPLASQAGDLNGLGVYTDQGLTTEYTSSSSVAVGANIYVMVSEATCNEIREGHLVMLRYYSATAPDASRDRRGKVVGRRTDGATSMIAIKMREADTATATNLSTANRIVVIGNSNSEGAAMPDGIQYDPTKYVNYTQIFRTPLRFTGTALSTSLRTSDPYKRQKARILKYHGIEMERALIYNGAPYEGTGSNGFPEREAGGLIKWIQTYAAANVDNYVSSTSVSASTTWVSGGKDWLDAKMESVFKYGRNRKLALVGTGALSAINALASQYGTVNISPKDRAYGMSVVEWVTPFGMLDLMIHPLFSHEKTESDTMLIVEPENIKMRPLKGRDTFYKKDDRLERGGASGIDGIEEEYLTEIGWEIHHPLTMGVFTGLGNTHAS